MSLLRNFFVIDKIDTKTLKSILKSIEEINTFKMNTKDIFQIDVIGFQKIEVTLTRFDGEQLGIIARFKVTKEHILSTLLTSILWNQQKKTLIIFLLTHYLIIIAYWSHIFPARMG